MTANVHETLAALADETRQAVIDLLSKEPLRASEIAAAIGLTPQAMSRHLRVLRRSGLIREEGIDDDARVRIYQLRREPFDNLRHWLDGVESFWVDELTSFRDHVKMQAKE